MPSTLPEQIEALTQKVNSLETNYASLVQKLDASEKARGDLAALVTKKDEAISKLTTDLAASNVKVEGFEAKVTELKTSLTAVEGKIKSSAEQAIELMASVGQKQPASFQKSEADSGAKTITQLCEEARAAKK